MPEKMTQQRFQDILDLGYELGDVEFKGPCSLTDNDLVATIIRAAIGMANRRNGGIIIVGITDEGKRRLKARGLSPEQLTSWQSYGDVAAKINAYCEPPIEFDLDFFDYEDSSLIILRVEEFLDVPVICRKQYDKITSRYDKGKEKKMQVRENILREGACYVRSFGKPATTELASYSDMRRLLDLAIEKGVQRFVEVALKAGLDIKRAVE